MERYTAEKIANSCIDLMDKANRQAINKMYYDQDYSNLWPIRGRFNVTKRAINRLYKFERETGEYHTGLEYCYLLEQIMSEIVNNNKNW
jgi:arginine decarboxylase-like protein